MSRALISGLVVLVAAHLLWFVVQQQFDRFLSVLALLMWAMQLIAAALVSYMSPRRKFLLGLSMTIPSVLLPLLFHGVYQLRGNKADFPGFDGAVSLSVMITPFMLILCAVGSLIGLLAANRLQRKRASPPSP